MSNVHRLRAACALALGMLSQMSHAAAVPGQGTWESTLLARDLDGDPATIEAYYDTALDISWLADVNYAETSGFRPAPDSKAGGMNLPDARQWAAGLDIGGITSWRLPIVAPVDGGQFNTAFSYDGSTDIGYNIGAAGSVYAGTPDSEMAHMFYVTLGNTGRYDLAGNYNTAFGLANTGPFTFPENAYYGTLPYWTGILVDSSDPEGNAYVCTLNEGQQRTDNNLIGLLYAWPVHDGDVGTVIVHADIDIRPGGGVNPVNPRSRGTLAVAVLTTEDLDASTLDIGTIRFGPGAAAPVSYTLEDVNHDTKWDLVLHFRNREAGIACGDTEAVLKGRSFAGYAVIGSDAVKPVGCGKKTAAS